MVKRRPVDVLQGFLEDRAAAKVEQFFGSYGAAEAAATCLLLCTAPPSPCSQVHPEQPPYLSGNWRMGPSRAHEVAKAAPMLCMYRGGAAFWARGLRKLPPPACCSAQPPPAPAPRCALGPPRTPAWNQRLRWGLCGPMRLQRRPGMECARPESNLWGPAGLQ